MQDFIIRDYEPSDFVQTNELWELTEMGGAARGDDQITIERTIKGGAKLLLMVAKKDAQLIGTSWMTHDFRRIFLHHFGIHPDFQNQGYSKPLLHESLKFAVSENMQIKLEVHQNNEIAKHIYTNIGFEYLGDYEVHIIRDIEKLKQQLL